MRDLRHRSSPRKRSRSDDPEEVARRGKAMRIADWQAKLDGFLALNDGAILEHAGRVSAARAKAKAARELARYEARRLKQ
jgi:hypothetical protein